MFDCSNCLKKCRADCCHGPVPMTMDFIKSHVPIRFIVEMKELGDGMYAPLSVYERDGKKWYVCPFLGLDDRCSAYDDRPEVCRLFADESHEMLICSWQDKDGRIRSRQERRRIEKVQFAKRDRIINKIRQSMV